jgi:signal transduction histidine kinase
MSSPLRLLLIEDSEDDAALLLRELRRSGFDVTHTRVETSAALARALEQGPWEVIIADYALPGFDGMAAFAQVQQRGLDVPFLIVSGQIGEDTAVAAMKAGVHDFLLKDKLSRLGPAVARELREARLRAERRSMQEQLLLSERLASLGLLAASVAHEINNPLASLLANLQYVSHALEEWAARTRLQEPHKALEDALLCARRIQDITRDIKVFSRPDESHYGPTDVHRVLDSSLRMAWNHIFPRARITKDYGHLPPVLGNEARLGQIFLNLLINAAQAIPEGDREAHEIRVVTRQEGPQRVRVEVRDTGHGIAPELRERIFDPFFTTKPAGVGTGLGLAICRRLITELGGEIGVESEPGRGTSFHVRLQVAQGGQVAEIIPLSPGRARKVLVVDDERVVGRALQRLLGRTHEVVVMDRGREALEHLASGHRYDAILCDLMMPELSGPQLHAALEQRVPEQARRMIFMTGGAFTEEARGFLAAVGLPCVDKPVDMDHLRKLLEALPPGGRAAPQENQPAVKTS